MTMPVIDMHPSVGAGMLQRAAVASLQANQVDPKFLYVTPHQAALWRQVFLRHSPIHANPEFVRIYHDAFTQSASKLASPKVLLAGLGCGTGLKERQLYSALKASGHSALFAAIDVSRDLVEESAQNLIAAGADHHRSLVCDLAEAEFLGSWLARLDGGLPRLITFFGLVPNFAPSAVIRLFRAVLRPGDVLLVSAHLAPVNDERGLSAAMQSVLPQYKNPETLAWLNAALHNWGLEALVESPEMIVDEVEGIPAFRALARWKNGETFEKWGRRFSPDPETPLQLFSSLRYTPSLFEGLLREAGLRADLLAITSCLEEAIWSVRLLEDIEQIQKKVWPLPQPQRG